MKFLVTGCAGFIGSHFVDMLVRLGHQVVGLDSLTYAGNRSNINRSIEFIEGNIKDTFSVFCLLDEHNFDGVFNFAAESHVCRSIDEPRTFIESNIHGTYTLLNESYKWWKRNRPHFRFIQISTDEVFGELGKQGKFNEASPFCPRSPYSASKASGDHLVSAWHHTYGMPTIITHCSNNYGPRQYPEKLIPITIKRILEGKPAQLHGTGQNVRDWIHVEDHCLGVWAAYKDGRPGDRYCFGGNTEKTNLEIIQAIKNCLQDNSEIVFVADRPGNDKRYAVDDLVAQRFLGWQRKHSFDQGIKETVDWYVNNRDWL